MIREISDEDWVLEFRENKDVIVDREKLSRLAKEIKEYMFKAMMIPKEIIKDSEEGRQ